MFIVCVKGEYNANLSYICKTNRKSQANIYISSILVFNIYNYAYNNGEKHTTFAGDMNIPGRASHAIILYKQKRTITHKKKKGIKLLEKPHQICISN